MVAMLPTSSALAATPSGLGLTASGDTTVLVDAPIDYSLLATNAGSSWQYNVTFREVLPVGVTYAKGSTTKPAGVGDPEVITIGTAPVTQQVLIWSNVSDLPAHASQTVAFKVDVDPDRYPVGATVSASGDVYGQTDPRTLPKFDAAGAPLAGSYTDTATSGAVDTIITAVTIDKSEDSPEHELMRGVHDDAAVYTLKVTNNDYRATTGATVVDYLPAGLEFLGCGGVDNGSTQEYGTRTLTETPTLPDSDCVEPQRVETVELAVGNAQKLEPGVYTRVTWSAGDLDPSDTWVTHYRAGIPQRENTMDFGGTTPAPDTLKQGANLDNNTGASTREDASSPDTQDGERDLTNTAEVAGDYTGAVASGTPTIVGDSSSVTVAAEDLAVQKSVSPGTFTQDGVATYTLEVETGEYADATDIVVTDVIPDGMCPLSTSATACTTDPNDFTATNADIDSIGSGTGNTWTVTFKPFDLDHQQTLEITYKVLMRTGYTGHGSAPTVSGDDYTNTVSLVGTTTTLTSVNAPDPDPRTIADVSDASEASIGSQGPSLTKTIMKQTTPYACAAGTYTDNGTTPQDDDSLRFRVGDRVCFTIKVDFSGENSTKNPVLTDFLPDYVQYETDSAKPVGSDSHLEVQADDPAVDGNRLTWTIGTTQSGTDRFVPKNSHFEWQLSAIVIKKPGAAPKPDITANLAKLSWTNTDGNVGFLRDQVDFSIGATPPLTVSKDHTGFAAGVQGNDLVPYTITVANTGKAADGDDIPVKNLLVRDVLPVGVDCSLISAIDNGGTCSDGAGSDPSLLEWTLAGPLDAGDSTAVGYTMRIPADPRIDTHYVNTAGVVSYDTATNHDSTSITHYPSNSDSHLTACGGGTSKTCDVPQAQDSDTVSVKNTTLTKTQATPVSANNTSDQAVIGEQITYRVTATVPARTAVYFGVLADEMPSGVELLSANVTLNGSAITDPSMQVTVNTNQIAGPDGVSVTLPELYKSGTGDSVFAFDITARVSTAGSNVQGAQLTNEASLRSMTEETGGWTMPDQRAATTAVVIEPKPTLTKTHDAAGDVEGGQVLTYTLTASNAAGRPTLYDAVVVDCIPAGLIDAHVADMAAGTSVDAPVAGGGGCASDETMVRWRIPSIAGGESKVLTYTVKVSDASVGGQVYPNTAALAGNDLDDVVDPTGAPGRPYGDETIDSVTVKGSSLAKTTVTPRRAVGERAEFTVTATVPAKVNYFDATLVDTLPAGLDASALHLESSTCTYQDNTSCTIGTGDLTADGQKVGWSLGDLTAADQARTISLTYTVPVADLDGLDAGDSLTNSAVLGWDITNRSPDPTDVTANPDHTTGQAQATVSVTEPDVSITKAVSDATPDPGQSFTYTLTVANSGEAFASAAHQVVIKDVVPDGVVVDAASISDHGSLAGADAQTGGGTITWTLDSLAAGGSKALTYGATLASPTPSATLTNTATVTSYCSVPFTAPATCDSVGGRNDGGPSATATVTAALPHVTIAKAAVGGDLAYLGASKTFRLTITSDGNSKAYGVSAVDVLPTNWDYDADSARVSVDGAGAQQIEPTISGQTLTWHDLGDLAAPGHTIVVTYTATPSSDAGSDPGVGHAIAHTNTASVTAEDQNGHTADRGDHPYNGPDATATVHVDSADIAIDKSVVGTAVAGQKVTWGLTVTNTGGPDAAAGPFIVSDPMPGVLTSLEASGDGWTCSVGDSTVTCQRTDPTETLAKGASFSAITVAGVIPATTVSGSHLTNTASVAAATYDPDKSNNHDTSDVTVTTAADMSVVKGLSGTVTAGGQATYTIDVANEGPSVHRGPLVVSDTLPAGTTFVSASGTNWACTTPAVGATGEVTCTRSDDMPVGTTDQITVVVHVASGRVDPVANTATVDGDGSGGTTDPEPSNDHSTVTRTPDTSADLSIDKSRVDDADFVAGKTASYLLTIHNDGPSDADHVEVSDTLPSYLHYVGFTAVEGDWSCSASGQAVTCTFADPLAASPGDGDGDAAVEIAVSVADDHRGDITNKASVDSSTNDPAPANNSDTDVIGEGDVNADLSIVKSHPAGDVVAGETVSYDLTVTNEGPSRHNAADGPVTVKDELPEGLTCVSVSGGDCSTDGDTATYSYTSDLAVDGSFTVTVVARVAASAGPATLVNQASVSGPEDKNPANDTTTDPTTIVDKAEIDLTKTVTGPDPVRAGETTSFALTAHNAGPSDADQVTITDALPAGMTVADLDGSGWTCDSATLTCTIGTLPAGESRTVTITVRVDSGVADGTRLVNIASATTGTAGDDPSDNSAQAGVDVTARADLVLVKKHVGDHTVVAGTDTSYTLDVHNAGPSDAGGPITVTDTLPAGMSYLSADGGWSCAAVAQTVTCTQDGPLLAGADTTTLTLLAHVDAELDDTAAATNTATVTATTTDPVPTNNDDEATVTVTRGADLSVVKRHTGTGEIDKPVDFTIAVHNAGPSTARAATVTDPLPTGLEYVSADGGAEWTCAYDDGVRTVTCDHVGPIAPDTDATDIHVVATVRAAAYPTVTNVATVASQTPDGDLDDNASSDRVDVAARADLSLQKKHVGALVVGAETHYLLTVHNDGPTEAPDTVTVTDPLPAGLTYVSASGDGWTCAAPSGSVVCERVGGLANGATSTIDLVVEVGPEAYPAVTNAATVTSRHADAHGRNNAADDGGGQVAPTVELKVKKSVAFQDGNRVGWDIAVTNAGPSATVAPAVVVDKLPAELHYESATGPGWDCAHVGQRVTCNRSSALASGAVSTVRVVTTVDAAPGTVIRNVATVSGGGARIPANSAQSEGKESTSAAKVTAASTKGSTRGGGSSESLPNTGGPAWWLVPLGALLVAAGGLLLRRRRS